MGQTKIKNSDIADDMCNCLLYIVWAMSDATAPLFMHFRMSGHLRNLMILKYSKDVHLT